MSMETKSEWEIDQIALNTHVKAVKFVTDFLLIGQGNRIHCYDWKRKKHCETTTVFQGIYSVHGIKPFFNEEENARIIFYGDKVFNIYNFHFTSEIQFTPVSVVQNVGDWIHDICFLESTDDLLEPDLVAIITAHNSVLFWNSKLQQKVMEYHCSSKCILYSAKIICNHTGAVVVACGTVFKEIVIWSPNTTALQGDRRVPFHSLTGHQGVIFSIEFNAASKLLCSSSDDRSLRLWQFNTNVSLVEEKSFTGTLDYWTKGSFSLVHVLFAHESRVWTSVILDQCIISVGEDSCICFWRHNGTLIRKEKSHRGGSIWCVDVNQNETLCVTGGSDSSVLLWGIKENSQDMDVQHLSVPPKDGCADFPRNLLLLMVNKKLLLFVITDKGRFLIYDANSYNHLCEHADESFSSYSIPSASPDNRLMLIGGLHGSVSLYALEFADSFEFVLLKKVKICSSKINNIHWIGCKPYKFLICEMDGLLTLWELNAAPYENYDFVLKANFYLPKSKIHWWSTVAVFIQANDILAIGDRSGSVHFYYSTSSCDKPSQKSPDDTYLNVHGKNGVSDLKINEGSIYSSGTDGKLIMYHAQNGKVVKLHTVKVTKELEWLGRIIFKAEDTILLGFHATQFIAWSQLQERSVMSVSCGGGHRSWDFILSEEGTCVFAAVRKKQILLSKKKHSLPLEDSVVQGGISGASFCCVCHLFDMNHEVYGGVSVLACGGEDPSMKLIAHAPNASSKFFTLYSISGHLSSIRAISKCAMAEENSFIVVSVGGRAQMMVWKVDRRKGIFCKELACTFLWNVDKPARRPWKNSCDPVVDPLTRFMDVVVWPSNSKQNEYLIASASSDSFLRLYVFNMTNLTLELASTVQHGDHCILKISPWNLRLQNSSNLFYITTAATDGYIRVYDAASFMDVDLLPTGNDSMSFGSSKKRNLVQNKPLLCKSVHQSGVNALDVNHQSDGLWLILAGGDDNAISATLVELNVEAVDLIGAENLAVVANGIEKNAHASQVTGIRILTDNYAVSVSVDQRVVIWFLERCNDCIEMKIVHSEMSCIPDAINLEVWMDNTAGRWKAVICGEGLEIFSIKTSNSNICKSL